MNRRQFLGLGGAAVLIGVNAGAEELPKVVVAKSPTCGCCGDWVEHMRAAGFPVEVRDVEQDQLYALKAQLGVRPEYQSCHTAIVGEYVIEGHVPAADVARLLSERPSGIGLAVPGMPIGSPGMEMGDEKEPYDTMLMSTGGGASVFASHR